MFFALLLNAKFILTVKLFPSYSLHFVMHPIQTPVHAGEREQKI